MYTLFIDTHFKNINLCLYKDKEIVDKVNILNAKSTSTDTMPQIINLVEKNKVNINQVAKIIVCNGPGSFTGVRIGVTLAKTLCYLSKAQLYTIDSLSLAALDNRGQNIYGIKENNGVYLAKFKDEKMISPITYHKNSELKESNDKINYEPNEPNFQSLINHLDTFETTNALTAKPLYIKTIEALNDKKN